MHILSTKNPSCRSVLMVIMWSAHLEDQAVAPLQPALQPQM